MKLLQQEQEELDAGNPDVESVSPVLSSRDMETWVNTWPAKGEVGEEKALQAARIVFSIQQSSLIDIFHIQCGKRKNGERTAGQVSG